MKLYGIAEGIEVLGAAAFPLAGIGGYQYAADGSRKPDSWCGLWWGVSPSGDIAIFTRDSGGPLAIDKSAPNWAQIDTLLNAGDGILSDPIARANARRRLCSRIARACGEMAGKAVDRTEWEEWDNWWSDLAAWPPLPT